MKRELKKIIACVLAVAMIVAGVNYAPKSVKAGSSEGMTLLAVNDSTPGGWTAYTGGAGGKAGKVYYSESGQTIDFYIEESTDRDWGIQLFAPETTLQTGKEYQYQISFTADKSGTFYTKEDISGTSLVKHEYSVGQNVAYGTFTAGEKTKVLMADFRGTSDDTTLSNISISYTDEFETEAPTEAPTADPDGYTNVSGWVNVGKFQIFEGYGGRTMAYKGTGTTFDDMSIKMKGDGSVEAWTTQIGFNIPNLENGTEYDYTIKFNSNNATTMFAQVPGVATVNDIAVVDGENTVSGSFTAGNNPAHGQIMIFPYLAADGTIFSDFDVTVTPKASEETTQTATTAQGETEEITTAKPSGYDWVKLGNGSGEAAGNDVYYDANSATNVSFVNIQKSFGTEAGIYTTYAAGISSVEVNGVTQNASCIQGAGALIYLSALTQEINEVTVNYAGGVATFLIKTSSPAQAPTEAATEEVTTEEVTTEEVTTEEVTTAKPSGYDWVKLGNGSGEAAGDDVYYDANSATNVSFVNIQKSFGTEAGIYTTYAAGISSVEVNGVTQNASCIQGAGALIYLSALTQEINEVTVNYAGGVATFLIKTSNPATEPVVETINYTLDGTAQTINEDEVLTVPTGCDGYVIEGDSNVYAPGYEIEVTEGMAIHTLNFVVDIAQGAAIRVNKSEDMDKAGHIRFQCAYSASYDVDALYDNNVEFGGIVATKTVFDNNENIFDLSSAAIDGQRVIIANANRSFADGNKFYIALDNISSSGYNKKYVAKTYVKFTRVKADKSSETVYKYSSVTNPEGRSVASVAAAIMNNGYGNYSVEEKAYIDYFASFNN